MFKFLKILFSLLALLLPNLGWGLAATDSVSGMASSRFNPSSSLSESSYLPNYNYNSNYNGNNVVESGESSSSFHATAPVIPSALNSVYPQQVQAAAQRQEFDPSFPIDDGDVPEPSSFLGGIGDAAGSIATAFGLGGLGVAGTILVLVIGGPLVALAVLFPVAVLIIAILAFPVVQLTLPPTDPYLARSLKRGVGEVVGRALDVVKSEECFERITCNVAKRAKGMPRLEQFILQRLDGAKGRWTSRLSRSVKLGGSGEGCGGFKCGAVEKVKELYRAFTGKGQVKE